MKIIPKAPNYLFMFKQFLLSIILLVAIGYLPAQQYGAFKDSRDGRIYKTVKIGSQVWMAENLNTDRFRNGDTIPEAKTSEEWEAAGKNQQPAWCYYENSPSNGIKYGKLYNWFAVMDPRGLAPKGWHMPSDAEWTALTDYLGGQEKAGVKMKSKNGWRGEGNGTNNTGFSGLPGGYRSSNMEFFGIGMYGYWWSSTENSTLYAWNRFLGYSFSNVYRYGCRKEEGLSVRCIMD